MSASNEKLFMFYESLRKIFLKLSFWTFALKFINLVIKFQITGPLYYVIPSHFVLHPGDFNL